MFLVMRGIDRAKQRLASAGVDLDDTANPDGWDVEEAGVVAEDYVADGRVFQTTLVVTVRKNCLAVSVNPQIGEALGYQPAAPQYLYPGYWGSVDVYVQTPEDAAKLAKLPWLVKLHLVPVAVLS